MKEKPILKLTDLPQPPKDAIFKLQKLDTVSMPHTYCITPRHVSWAADHFGGMLSVDAIRDAEKHGASCDICRKSGRGMLTYDQHENSLTLFIGVPQNSDLNGVSGLHKYLFSNKETFIKQGVQGFAFPTL